jgi:hypothetical protein
MILHSILTLFAGKYLALNNVLLICRVVHINQVKVLCKKASLTNKETAEYSAH